MAFSTRGCLYRLVGWEVPFRTMKTSKITPSWQTTQSLYGSQKKINSSYCCQINHVPSSAPERRTEIRTEGRPFFRWLLFGRCIKNGERSRVVFSHSTTHRTETQQRLKSPLPVDKDCSSQFQPILPLDFLFCLFCWRSKCSLERF